MQRWGKHPSGKVRWRCKSCGKSTVRSRSDNRYKSRLSLFVFWISGKWSLSDFAVRERVSVRTISRWFEPFWFKRPVPLPLVFVPRILVLDGTVLKRGELTLLVASDGDTGVPLFWKPVARENGRSWEDFLRELSPYGDPSVIICDAQAGLLKARGVVYPAVPLQRCLIHVIRQARNWLTQNPKTRAAQELLGLVLLLSSIRTKRQRRRWVRQFKYWKRRHHAFLNERTISRSGKWWYTHRTIRRVRSLLTNALPDLFRYVTDPTVPRTSNTVEGGVNARLKELIRCHRGISLRRKLTLCAWYLALRQGQKPTLNVH